MQWVTANAVGHLPFYDVDLRVLYGFGLLPAANFQFPYVVRNTLTLPEFTLWLYSSCDASHWGVSATTQYITTT